MSWRIDALMTERSGLFQRKRLGLASVGEMLRITKIEEEIDKLEAAEMSSDIEWLEKIATHMEVIAEKVDRFASRVICDRKNGADDAG